MVGIGFRATTKPRWTRYAALTLALGAAGGLATPASAQSSLDTAVARALENACAPLGPSLGPNLTTVCNRAGIPTVAGVSTPGADPTSASSAGGQDPESRVRRRLQELRSEQTTPTSTRPFEANFAVNGLSGFMSFDYENVDKRTTEFTAGLNSDKYGGTIGLDYSFGKFVLGGAFAFSRTDGTFKDNVGNFQTDSYGGYLYGSYLPIDGAYIDGVFGYARKDMSLNRNIAFTNTGNPAITANGTANSSTNGNEYRAGLSGGYDWTVGAITFGPRVGVTYVRADTDAFSENGNTGLELAFDSQSTDSFTSSIGAHGTMAISTSFGVLVPQASADWIHEFMNAQRTFNAHFVQDTNASPLNLPFVNDRPDRDYFGLGVGIVAVLPNGLSPFANYRALVGDSIKTTQTATIGLRVEF